MLDYLRLAPNLLAIRRENLSTQTELPLMIDSHSPTSSLAVAQTCFSPRLAIIHLEHPISTLDGVRVRHPRWQRNSDSFLNAQDSSSPTDGQANGQWERTCSTVKGNVGLSIDEHPGRERHTAGSPIVTDHAKPQNRSRPRDYIFSHSRGSSDVVLKVFSHVNPSEISPRSGLRRPRRNLFTDLRETPPNSSSPLPPTPPLRLLLASRNTDVLPSSPALSAILHTLTSQTQVSPACTHSIAHLLRSPPRSSRPTSMPSPVRLHSRALPVSTAPCARSPSAHPSGLWWPNESPRHLGVHSLPAADGAPTLSRITGNVPRTPTFHHRSTPPIRGSLCDADSSPRSLLNAGTFSPHAGAQPTRPACSAPIGTSFFRPCAPLQLSCPARGALSVPSTCSTLVFPRPLRVATEIKTRIVACGVSCGTARDLDEMDAISTHTIFTCLTTYQSVSCIHSPSYPIPSPYDNPAGSARTPPHILPHGLPPALSASCTSLMIFATPPPARACTHPLSSVQRVSHQYPSSPRKPHPVYSRPDNSSPPIHTTSNNPTLHNLTSEYTTLRVCGPTFGLSVGPRFKRLALSRDFLLHPGFLFDTDFHISVFPSLVSPPLVFPPRVSVFRVLTSRFPKYLASIAILAISCCILAFSLTPTSTYQCSRLSCSHLLCFRLAFSAFRVLTSRFPKYLASIANFVDEHSS
ncbi:hypothetical protein BS47DRAFT_1390921 [Hydnum rufescens UP504]|uniref:Uncharacterized protein n=1 Tax=Hydnum rufescens UP504 TaxID=1448309 RepID=A0A9P6B3H7_9AGAM|nr:hypothetical protein BS47DRAFT_1390921 [Hydnum rufescens UP504]